MIAFKLSGGVVPRRPEILHTTDSTTPPAVTRRGSPEQIAEGATLFLRNCAKCHANIDGRGAGIPDLRLMSADTPQAFSQIVLQGTLAERGMGDFSDLLDASQVEALHLYLIDEAWQLFERRTQGSEWHAAEQALP